MSGTWRGARLRRRAALPHADAPRKRKGGATTRFVLRRIVVFPIALVALITISFALVNLVPSDPAVMIAGPNATPAVLSQLRHQLGLDRSVARRYVSYLSDLSQGDLGRSIYTGRPITIEIRTRVTSTIELVVATMLVGGLFGTALGAFGAFFEGRTPARIARVVVSVSQAVPEFMMGILLIFVVFYTLRLAPPPVGQLGLGDTSPARVTGAAFVDSILAGNFGTAVTALRYMILPVLAMAFIVSAFFAKTARTAFSEALHSPATEFARSCGLPRRTIVWYAFTQARTPLITYAGILFPALIGGEAIVEYLFAWGGVGSWAIGAIQQIDIPAIQGFVLLLGVATLATFLVVEVIIVRLDPRLHFGQVRLRR